MVRQWVDYTRHSVIALCACGWRSGALVTREAAWAAAEAHADHAGHDTARAADARRHACARARAAS